MMGVYQCPHCKGSHGSQDCPALTRRARHLAAADQALAEGDESTARIILDGIAYADRYGR